MQTIVSELSNLVSDAFVRCGYDRDLGNVIISNRPDLCHYQCDGAFRGAKQYRKAPLAIASEVAGHLKGQAIFTEVSAVAPGFINLTLSDEKIVDYVNKMISQDSVGIPKTENVETIIIDYGGPNIAKPLHIGHLRAAIIGESLKRLMKFLGYHVIGDIHLGDWGLQIGLVIAELSERFPGYSCFSGDYHEGDALPSFTADDLNEIYPFASNKSKSDAQFSEKAHNFTFELQQGNAGFIALWKLILQTSVEDLKKNYDRLNVEFDLWLGESDADKYVGDVIALLNEKGLLEDSNGAKIVNIANESDRAPTPPAIIVKSDGAINYETTDIATILQRERDYSPDKIWYVVDKRQELHFIQVFRTSKMAGIAAENMELLHLGFGTMNGSDGKPYKTREGGIMRLSEMIETVTAGALEKMRESMHISLDMQQDVARKIGVAAIKFGDLINHRTKDYIFDLDKFLSFEGRTGTYILYTIARINSILKKAGYTEDGSACIGGIYSDSERGLLLKAVETGNVFWTAAGEKAPNYICENAYQIAAGFSQFYHENHILHESDEVRKTSWLNLCRFVRMLLTLHLDVLGIDTVEFM